MKYHNTILLLILGIFINVQSANSQGNKWTLAKNKNGIVVLTHLSKDSNNIGYIATMTVEANMEDISKIINDVPGYKNWIANLKYAKTLKKINNNERYEYYLTY